MELDKPIYTQRICRNKPKGTPSLDGLKNKRTDTLFLGGLKGKLLLLFVFSGLQFYRECVASPYRLGWKGKPTGYPRVWGQIRCEDALDSKGLAAIHRRVLQKDALRLTMLLHQGAEVHRLSHWFFDGFPTTKNRSRQGTSGKLLVSLVRQLSERRLITMALGMGKIRLEIGALVFCQLVSIYQGKPLCGYPIFDPPVCSIVCHGLPHMFCG